MPDGFAHPRRALLDRSGKLPGMSASDPIIAVNGVFDDPVSAFDRGLAYGDGLFETCRVYAGAIPLWPLHRERLQSGCARLKLPLDWSALDSQRAEVLARAKQRGNDSGVLKLMVTRGSGGRGYAPPPKPTPMLCWIFYPGNQAVWHERSQEGAAVRFCNQRLSENPTLAGLKHLSRLDYVLARAEWADEFAEGLLLDARDRVIEGTVSNVFVVEDDRLITPALERSGVAGVMRRLILEQLATTAGLGISVEPITRAQLLSADEVLVCNSVFGIWPVVSLAPDNRHWTPGPVTRQLQKNWADWLDRGDAFG